MKVGRKVKFTQRLYLHVDWWMFLNVSMPLDTETSSDSIQWETSSDSIQCETFSDSIQCEIPNYSSDYETFNDTCDYETSNDNFGWIERSTMACIEFFMISLSNC